MVPPAPFHATVRAGRGPRYGRTGPSEEEVRRVEVVPVEADEVDPASPEVGEVDMDTGPFVPGVCPVQNFPLRRDAEADQNEAVLSVGEVVDAVAPVSGTERRRCRRRLPPEQSVVAPTALEEVAASVSFEPVVAVAALKIVVAVMGATYALDVRDRVGERLAVPNPRRRARAQVDIDISYAGAIESEMVLPAPAVDDVVAPRGR